MVRILSVLKLYFVLHLNVIHLLILTYRWLNDLFKKRKKKALQIKDIYEVLPYHSSRYLHQKVKG